MTNNISSRLPIIKQIAEQEYTGILYDFKSPELTEKIRASYSGSIVKFRNVDFKNPYQSDRINPIAPNYLTKSVIVLEYSQTLVNNLIPETNRYSHTLRMRMQKNKVKYSKLVS